MSFFISEVSSNHSANLDRCIEFIKKSAVIGCDAVKFQLFKIDELFSPEILKNSKEHRSRKRWELPLSFLGPLAEESKKNNIQFSCTPFYLDAVDELYPYVDFYKIASYELLWDELLIKCSQTNKPLILSTGMATMEEVAHAVHVCKKAGVNKLSLLHCSSAYPTPINEVNLSAIQTLRECTGCSIGWSDHTVSPDVIFRAIYKWNASIIEFHLDLEGEGDEFSSGHCWLPNQIEHVINSVHSSFSLDGDGIKTPNQSELPDRDWRADPIDGLRPMQVIRENFLKTKT
jgi:sialic acid synthase SpsE